MKHEGITAGSSHSLFYIYKGAVILYNYLICLP